MIERNEEILPDLTDEALIAMAKALPRQEKVVHDMLTVPPEYRQGIQAAITNMMFDFEYRDDFLEVSPTGVDQEDARRIALDELVRQGVELGSRGV
jgi:hypothetical protein